LEIKNILITGSTDGIGKQTAFELAKYNHRIILHGRSEKKCIDTLNYIVAATGNNNIEYVTADFSIMDDVRIMAGNLISRFNRLDILINNAGLYMNEKILTPDGIETTFAVNHLAPFLLTNLLLNLITNSQPSRIINVSSVAHKRANLEIDYINAKKSYDAYEAYALSKLANILFTNGLADKLMNYKTTVNSLHPGVITTKLLRKGFNITGASLEKGAETSVYLAVSEDVKEITGRYFVDKKIEEQNETSSDSGLINYFWSLSEKLVGLN